MIQNNPTRKSVLVVEDDMDIQSSIVQILVEEGYEAHGVSNGQEALDLLNASTQLPSLIILDIMMPIMNGWEFRCLQKRDTLLASIPVIVCSSAGDIQEEARLIGARDYLQKPVVPEVLLEMVGQCC